MSTFSTITNNVATSPTDTAAQRSQQMQAALKIIDPDISADPETVERKIIDTVAEVMAGGNVGQNVLQYAYDIDSLTGTNLDNFVAVFGFARQAGVYANGTVTFSVNSPAAVDTVIPAGTSVAVPASTVAPQTTFQTTASVTLYTGTTSVDAPIECTTVGTIGNVAAFTINSFGGLTSSGSVSSVVNNAATAGGANEETDASLIIRFKNTFLRNASGTNDQYLAIAIASVFADKANVLGPISRFTEYLQIEGGTATSTIPYSQYTYPFDYYLTNGDFGSETFYNPKSIDYTFGTSVPPTITVVNSTNLPNGSVVLLEHSYCSSSSRNVPASSIANYVDVYVSGADDFTVNETVLTSSLQTFTNISADYPYINNWQRYNDRSTPINGNGFQLVIWQPVDFLPTEISMGSLTFYENIDYFLVKDITTNRGSKRGADGIEWTVNAVAQFPNNFLFTLSYIFNRLPLTLNEVADDHKQITTDVLYHAANLRYFDATFVIAYTPGYSVSAVNSAITTALTTFIENYNFGAVIQMSSLEDVVYNVPGVSNVRLAQPGDGSTYGVQEIAPNGVNPIGGAYLNDFSLEDSDLPVFNQLNTIQKSVNTWS